VTDDSNLSHLPVDVDFDLDAYERPAEEIIPDYRVKVGGKVLVMSSPDDINWLDLIEITDPIMFLRHSLSREDLNHLLAQKMPGHLFGKFMEGYYTHFKIQERMEEAQRANKLGLA
jgi:hypothetical protein